MYVQEVTTRGLFKEFIYLPYQLYKSDKNWIAHLIKDIESIFNEHQNTFINQNNYKCFLLIENKKIIGRIATFVHPSYSNKGDDFKMGCFGFFECIDNQEGANLLFNAAKNWLLKNGCEGMDGPVNFGERNKFWGLLIEGFYAPLYGMNYNPAYYKKLFENFGFQIFYEQYCFKIDMKDWKHERFSNLFERIQKNNQYTTKQFKINQLTKFAQDFCEIYNEAWQKHEGNKSITFEEIFQIFSSLKSIIKEDLIYFVYDKEMPIGFFINLPELNFYFKNINGKLNWWNKIKLFIKIKCTFNPKIVGLVYGVKSAYQNKGIDALLISALYKKTNNSKYKSYEMQWIGEFNLKMCKFVKQINFTRNRTLATYRFFFNPNHIFKKHPNI